MKKKNKGKKSKRDIKVEDKEQRKQELSKEISEQFFKQFGPDHTGTGYLTNNWKVIFFILPLFLPYLLILLNLQWVFWVLLIFNIFTLGLLAYTINVFKIEFTGLINVIDYTRVLFSQFTILIFAFAFTYYLTYLIDPTLFKMETKATLFEFIYISFLTATTLGFGDITPNSIITKLLFLVELLYCFYFLVTVIPIITSMQYEKLSTYGREKRKLLALVKKGEQEGNL